MSTLQPPLRLPIAFYAYRTDQNKIALVNSPGSVNDSLPFMAHRGWFHGPEVSEGEQETAVGQNGPGYALPPQTPMCKLKCQVSGRRRQVTLPQGKDTTPR